MGEQFRKSLQAILKTSPFARGEALSLSRKIHNAEDSGYAISSAEERLWGELTAKIQETKNK
jgi:hypothetical protein